MKYGDITVIIPVKERLNLLKSALISINNQSLIPKYVLIIDDASSEKISINRKYKFNYKIIRNKKNIGVSETRNKGIKLCKTKYVCFIDTDDIWKKNKLKLQYNLAEKNKLDFVYCNYKSSKLVRKKTENNQEIFNRLINNWSNPNGSSFFFKNTSLIKLGLFDKRLKGSEDHDLWFRIALSDLRVNYINANLVNTSNFNNFQISRNYYLREESLEIFFKKYKKFIPKTKYSKFKKHIYTKAFIPVLNGAIKNLDILIAIKCMKHLIFSKLFYKRYLHFLFGNFLH